LVVCILLCSCKEGFGQQKRFDGPVSMYKLAFIPDSLKTPKLKELELKLIRVYNSNIKFRGDSIAFLLDKDAFLSEGFPEEAYLEIMEVLRQFNDLCRNTEPQIRQAFLSTYATNNAVYLKFFGLEYSGDIPLLEYEGIRYTGPGGSPSIVNMKSDVLFVPIFPPGYFVVPEGTVVVDVEKGASVDTLKVVPK